ncbi:MAG: hypothetical protein QOE45_3038 [Frankiaceae bacterium]|nr:hypothetical protein [Frankiaceae bacterium]
MRTVYRVVTTAVALGAVFPFGAVTAHADTANPQVDQANWFWAEQVGGTIPGSPGVPYPTGVPDQTVPKDSNDLAVAGNPAQQNKDPKGVDKEAYLSFGLATVPVGSTVTSFTFTVPLDPAAHSAYDPNAVPVLVACAPKGGWGQGALGQNGDQFDGKPADDCANAPEGKFDAAKLTYTFDVTDLAAKWAGGDFNFGVAIRNAEDYTTPFNLVLGPVEKITAAIDFTAPAPVVVPTTPPVPPVDNGGVTPPTTGGYTGGIITPPVVDVPVPQPQPQQPPVTPVTAPRPAVQIAARPLTQETSPSAGFWLAMLAGVVLLGVVSLVLGDPEVAVAASRDRGLDRALRRRSSGKPAATPGFRPRTV